MDAVGICEENNLQLVDYLNIYDFSTIYFLRKVFKKRSLLPIKENERTSNWFLPIGLLEKIFRIM